MERFINTENIRNYRKLLIDPSVDTDPARRAMLVRLLADELAKDADLRLTMRASEPNPAQQREVSSTGHWANMHRSDR
jgi:hypothetical protein